jgi:hypothetical protein
MLFESEKKIECNNTIYRYTILTNYVFNDSFDKSQQQMMYATENVCAGNVCHLTAEKKAAASQGR